MEILWIILGVIGGGVLVYLILNNKKEEKKEDTGLNLILQQINELSRTVDNKIGASQREVNEIED